MVSIKASAVITSPIKPMAPMRLALDANCVNAPKTGRAMPSGTRFCKKYFSKATWKDENMGKAVKAASMTVSNGTKEIRVVKVKLPAVRPNRSSRNRCPKTFKVPRQGQCLRACHQEVGC